MPEGTTSSSAKPRRRETLRAVPRSLGTILSYEILWKGIALVLLGPLSIAILHALVSLTQEPAVANTGLIAFGMSPLGVTTGLVFGVLWATIVLLEHAGVLLIAERAGRGLSITPESALFQTLRESRRLVGI